jgi:predicted DNA-binding transcriptional regulator YafY
MRRADRLFQIVQHLRGGRLVTAKMLGDHLEVSERTIYRDIADLQSTGVGYIMREGFDLPPLMFTKDEIVALVAGARMVRAMGGATMARAAIEALVKIETVLPPSLQTQLKSIEIHVPDHAIPDRDKGTIDLCQSAVEARRVMELNYADVENRETRRTVRPLGLWYWGKVWTLVAWCELRTDFRVFRIDRVLSAGPTGAVFKHERGKMLADFYREFRPKEE